jgi:rsbT co-antagonist protein RsbR
MANSLLPGLLKKSRADILEDWLKRQIAAVGMRADLIQEDELRGQSNEFLQRFQVATQSGELSDIKGAAWAPVIENLNELSRTRGRAGFSPSETASFVFSLKQPSAITAPAADHHRRQVPRPLRLSLSLRSLDASRKP